MRPIPHKTINYTLSKTCKPYQAILPPLKVHNNNINIIIIFNLNKTQLNKVLGDSIYAMLNYALLNHVHIGHT